MKRTLTRLATLVAALMMICLFSSTNASAATPHSTLTLIGAPPAMHPTFTAGGTSPTLAIDVKTAAEDIRMQRDAVMMDATSFGLTAMKDDVKSWPDVTIGAHALLDDGHRFYLYQR